MRTVLEYSRRMLHAPIVVLLTMALGAVPLRARASEPDSAEARPPSAEAQDAPPSVAPPDRVGNRTAVPNAAMDPTPAAGLSNWGAPSIDPPEGSEVGHVGMASVDPSTGASRASIPFALPRARGAAQPGLSLLYSSMAANSTVGYGWTLSVPSIVRHNPFGGPRFADPPPESPLDPNVIDAFEIAGQRLVPICFISGSGCTGGAVLQPGERLPEGMDRWHYFRAEVDDGARYFWSPDKRTWVRDSKSGIRTTFGVPLDDPDNTGPIDVDSSATPQNPKVYRWNVSRENDFQNTANTIVYEWEKPHFDSIGYLTHIYDTLPRASESPGREPKGAFAHHTRLHYAVDVPGEPPAPRSFGHARIWRRRPVGRLTRVDVSSADFDVQENAPRRLVRRYRLRYYPYRHFAWQVRSHLKDVNIWHGCADLREDASFSIADDRECGTSKLVAEMEYTGRVNQTNIQTRAQTFMNHAADPVFLDVSGDGLPDVLAPAPTVDKPQLLTVTDPLNDPIQLPMLVDAPGLGADNTTLISRSVHAARNGQWILGDWLGDGYINALWFRVEDATNPLGAPFTLYRAFPTVPWKWLGGREHGKLKNFGALTHPAFHQVVDADSDGFPDVVSAIETLDEEEHQVTNVSSVLTARTAGGKVLPFERPTCANAFDCAPHRTPHTNIYTQAVADVTGDGIPDLMRLYGTGVNEQRWYIRHGIGDGTFADWAPFMGYERINDRDNYPFAPNQSYLHDVNGDGLADYIFFRVAEQSQPNGISVRLATSDGFTPQDILIPPPSGTRFSEQMRLDFADMNGSGTDDIIVTASNDRTWARYYSLFDDGAGGFSGSRTGLLRRIHGEGGAETRIGYTPSTETAKMKGWHLPTPLSLVRYIAVLSNAPSSIAGGPYVTWYKYDEPVYDPDQRRFRGFKVVNEEVEGEDERLTRTQFLVGNCADGAFGTGAPCQSGIDNPWGALHGPHLVDRYQTNGVHLSTDHRQYRTRKLYDGMDGHKVRIAFVELADSWLYDTANFVAQEDVVKIAPFVSSDFPHTPRNVTLATGAAGRAHIQVRTEQDGFGNVTEARSFGNVDGSAAYPKDQVIVQAFTPVIPDGDPTRWAWRIGDAYIRDEAGTNLRHTHYTYTQSGKVMSILGDLTGTLPLVRFHENGAAAVAPTPADASQDRNNLTLSAFYYDQFGNPTYGFNATRTRCTKTSYDPAFNQLPIAETVFVNGCDRDGLTSITRYDRALEVPTLTIAPDGAVSTIEYDSWGRVTQAFKPDSDIGSIPQSDPAIKITYIDVPAGPFQKMQVQERDDDGTSPRYRSTWSWIDPFGQTAATVREADPAAGDGGPYIVSGTGERDKSGRIIRVDRPYFDDYDVSLAGPPRGPGGGVVSLYYYDAFDRVVDVRRPIEGTNQRIARYAYHALSQDAFTAADLASGATPHPTTTIRDGHGRVTLTQRATEQNGGADILSTRTSYAITGEVVGVTRTHSAGGETYARYMKYDSFGRIVENAEPNTSTDFLGPDMRTWRYAYNDNGDMVGTSDARGCGKNAQYDGVGRLVAEIYSPCTRTQPDYEEREAARYIYDEPEPDQTPGRPRANQWKGRLAAVYDRAAHTQYFYDGRGRTTAVKRQVAIPNEDHDPLTEYAPHWFTRATTYDERDRIIAQSTGADVEELMGQEITRGAVTGRDLVTTDYTARGIAHRIGGSYGDLITSKKADADGFVRFVEYGDIAITKAEYWPNAQRILSRALISRQAPTIWDPASAPPDYRPPTSDPPSTAQLVLQDVHVDAYDPLDNALVIRDARTRRSGRRARSRSRAAWRMMI